MSIPILPDPDDVDLAQQHAMDRNADALRAMPAAVRDECLVRIVRDDDIGTASYLVGLGARINRHTLRVAATLIDSDMFEALLTLQTQSSEVLNEMMIFASVESLTRPFRILMATGKCDIHAASDSVLRCAARYGNLDILRDVVAMRINLDVQDCAAIRGAAVRRCVESVKILADAGASINHERLEHDVFAPVRIAALQGDIRMVRMLIEQGAHLHLPNLTFCAVLGNSADAVMALIEAGSPSTDACVALAEERGYDRDIIDAICRSVHVTG